MENGIETQTAGNGAAAAALSRAEERVRRKSSPVYKQKKKELFWKLVYSNILCEKQLICDKLEIYKLILIVP